MMISVEQLHRALGGKICRAKDGTQQVLCQGPTDTGKYTSLAVKPADGEPGFIICTFDPGDTFEQCMDYVRSRLGIAPFKPGINGNGRNGHTYDAPPKKPRNPVATHDYCDEEGKLLFQVLKFGKGDFTQRRSNPEKPGDWIYSLGDVRRVPYRLPELIEAIASGHPVFVVEGEKDVDALWNLQVPATTNPHGAGKWRDEYSQPFLGAKVYLIPDNDLAGRKHIVRAKQSLEKYAVAVHVVELPGVPENGGDVSDWIRSGGDAQKLYALAEAAESKEWTFKDTGDSKQESPEQEPEIDLGTVFTFIGDAPAAPPKELIKGLIPSEGVVVTGGQSGGGKTFIQLHKAICLGTTTPYFGHKIVERVGTVLVAAEGRPLLPNRFAAGLSKLSITDRLPISWLKQLPDFSSNEGIKLFIAQLKALDKKYRGRFWCATR